MASVITWQRVFNYKGFIIISSSGSAELRKQKLLKINMYNLISKTELILNIIVGMARNSRKSYSKLLQRTQTLSVNKFRYFKQNLKFKKLFVF